MIQHSTLLFFLLPLLVVSCRPDEDIAVTVDEEPVFDRLAAVIHPTEGNRTSGIVTFSREGEDVRVIATVTGLEPERNHGFHIHEYGDCTAGDAESAGGHFDPYGMLHGAPTDDQRHQGDLGNLASDGEGVAELNYVDTILEMHGPFSIVGRSVVVHAGEDDFQTQPTGDAGDRIGCGVIGVAQPPDAD